MKSKTVSVTLTLPDSSTITDEQVKDAVMEAIEHMEQYNDQSIFNWHKYNAIVTGE